MVCEGEGGAVDAGVSFHTVTKFLNHVWDTFHIDNITNASLAFIQVSLYKFSLPSLATRNSFPQLIAVDEPKPRPTVYIYLSTAPKCCPRKAWKSCFIFKHIFDFYLFPNSFSMEHSIFDRSITGFSFRLDETYTIAKIGQCLES